LINHFTEQDDPVFSLLTVKSVRQLFCVASIAVLTVQVSTPRPAFADGAWGFDSVTPEDPSKGDANDEYHQVYRVMMGMADAWNAHNLDAYLECFWKSPDLLVIVEGDQMKGWTEINNTYRKGYANPADMGTLLPERVQIQMISSDVALVLDWWTLMLPKTVNLRSPKVVGTSTLVLKKLPEGWRIVADHSSFVTP
jgi:uncharacterized protein (TIGR02246 family)